jgi:hypothetical protein
VLIERSRHRALAGRDPCGPGRRGHHRRGGSEPHPAGLCRLLRAPRAVDRVQRRARGLHAPDRGATGS